MIRLITVDDIIDTFLKGKQRGWEFIISKFTFSSSSRTKSAFNKTSKLSSNWWIIPSVQARRNLKITGNPKVNYKQFLMQDILKDRTNLKLLSLGSGTCRHEMELACYENFEKITCVDLSKERIDGAIKHAKSKNLNNIEFLCSNIDKFEFKNNYYDVVLFNSSLHHFKDVKHLLTQKINKCLNDSGLLVINEYIGPNRLQFPKHQTKAINNALNIIPKKFKKRYNSTIIKDNFYGSGVLRMIIADPSECVDSANIKPTIHNNFDTIIEKPYGGNILMNVLKDISHHFLDLNDEKRELLHNLFQFEDDYLDTNSSDFLFGVYKKQ
ncbi:class I SAM-dependent methyltransferase [Psychroserpens burtonensis]|uniref:Class I SAM-dependent methyltransferase n=1 Tax=Psychroserpens burtonensis TaxID=49278 RepID=A0A5C7B6G1_9FLAO|nr:class I SAM-dependent methyltransferase [Psychroserpens burtonensis]TXE17424.1 class I SAM-dependent methyltransferase [Psychroserpens burtonensis]